MKTGRCLFRKECCIKKKKKCFAFDSNHILKYIDIHIKYWRASFIIYDNHIPSFTSSDSWKFKYFLLFLILITSDNQILLWGSWFTRMSRSYLTFHLILMWLVYNDEDVLIILQMNYSLLKTTPAVNINK